MCPAEGCIFVKGHGGEHFTPEDSHDHSDEIRIRLLRDKVAYLEAQLAEARKDVERLDWMIGHHKSIGFASGDRAPEAWVSTCTLRSTIDAAMEKKL